MTTTKAFMIDMRDGTIGDLIGGFASNWSFFSVPAPHPFTPYDWDDDDAPTNLYAIDAYMPCIKTGCGSDEATAYMVKNVSAAGFYGRVCEYSLSKDGKLIVGHDDEDEPRPVEQKDKP